MENRKPTTSSTLTPRVDWLWPALGLTSLCALPSRIPARASRASRRRGDAVLDQAGCQRPTATVTQAVDQFLRATGQLCYFRRGEPRDVAQPHDLALVRSLGCRESASRRSSLSRRALTGSAPSSVGVLTSSTGIMRWWRGWSTARLRATRMTHAKNGPSRSSYLPITWVSFANTCWVTSSASWESCRMLRTYPNTLSA